MERLFYVPWEEMSRNVTIIELDINDVLELKNFKDEEEFEQWLQTRIGQAYLAKSKWLLIGFRGGLGYMKIHNKYLIAIPCKKEMLENLIDIPYKVVE